MLVKDLARFKMEVEKRLHDQLEVQRQLQLRIEAQGKYLQKIIEEQKLGGAIEASNGVPSADDDNKGQASQSEPPADAPAESSSSS